MHSVINSLFFVCIHFSTKLTIILSIAKTISGTVSNGPRVAILYYTIWRIVAILYYIVAILY